MSPARMRLEGIRAEAMERARQRLTLLLILFAGSFLLVAGRTLELGLLEAVAETPMASRGALAPVPVRADIVDRNGEILATNLEVQSLYADPAKVLDPAAAAAALVRVMPELSEAEVRARLEGGRRFVWVKRKLTPEQVWRVNALGLPGLGFETEQERIYPQGRLAAHVVGFTDPDGKGLAGIEHAFDARLSDPARGSEPLALSLDLRVQHALTDEISRAVERFTAKAGAGLVLDVETGELLALASLPDFDPNHGAAAGEEQRLNRISQAVYELGSIFKIFTVAAALEAGVADLDDTYDARKPLKAARFLIRDDHPQNRVLSVPEVFIHSSNIGAARMALDIGGERQQAFLRAAGLMRPASVELPEVGRPILPDRWREVRTMTVAYGHGIAVSPLQAASAVAAVVNGGHLIPATLIAKPDGHETLGHRILSEQTSRDMRRLMRLAVTEGTGEQAAVPGYRLAGKTGTAEKAVAGGYARKALLSSFVGVFPGDAPRYLVFVMLDEPTGTKETAYFETGGWTAAPAVGRVVSRIAPMLGVAPRPEEAPELHRAALQVAEIAGGGP